VLTTLTGILSLWDSYPSWARTVMAVGFVTVLIVGFFAPRNSPNSQVPTGATGQVSSGAIPASGGTTPIAVNPASASDLSQTSTSSNGGVAINAAGSAQVTVRSSNSTAKP